MTTVKGPVLVLAGPGSGKTRVLAHRVAYLLRVAGAHPRAVMAVTFTNKAAGEMRERINRLLGEAVPVSSGWKGLTIGTFHCICARILRAEAGPAGLNPNYVIYDDGEQLIGDPQCAARPQDRREDVPARGDALGHLQGQERAGQARRLRRRPPTTKRSRGASTRATRRS